jgi:hypothetical protein
VVGDGGERLEGWLAGGRGQGDTGGGDSSGREGRQGVAAEIVYRTRATPLVNNCFLLRVLLIQFHPFPTSK